MKYSDHISARIAAVSSPKIYTLLTQIYRQPGKTPQPSWCSSGEALGGSDIVVAFIGLDKY